MSTPKQHTLDMLKQLPDKATWDDILYGIFVLKKVEAGMRAANEGQIVPHERVKRFYALTDKIRRAMKQRGISEKSLLADFERTRKLRRR